jgi:hypothetical protein
MLQKVGPGSTAIDPSPLTRQTPKPTPKHRHRQVTEFRDFDLACAEFYVRFDQAEHGYWMAGHLWRSGIELRWVEKAFRFLWDDFYLPSPEKVVKLARRAEAASKVDPEFEEYARLKESIYGDDL